MRPGERDAFLVAADKHGPDGELKRSDVYQEYLCNRLRGASVEQCRLIGFRIARMSRRRDKGRWAQRRWPEAKLIGSLTVNDPAEFLNNIGKGIGRQRAFGMGMLRLEPEPAVKQAA